jgi:hypothetical protein
MPDTSRRTAEEVLRTYFRAKDENRPHLIRDVFSETATLETIVKTDAISFPPISRGLAPITDVLVRKFAQLYENVYSFYLDRPPSHIPLSSFSCDWLVGMSEKETGKTRVGCGRYDWQFQATGPRLADRLVITIEAMQVLSADHLEPVLLRLTGLPSPGARPRRFFGLRQPSPIWIRSFGMSAIRSRSSRSMDADRWPAGFARRPTAGHRGRWAA